MMLMKPIGKNKQGIIGWIFSAPFFLNAAILFSIPLVWVIWLSGTDWNLMALSWNFVGLQNAKTAFFDENVRKVFVNGIKYFVAVVPLVCMLSLFIAVVIHNVPQKLKGLFSVIFFIPYLTSGVATSVFVRFFLSYSSSFNQWLRNDLHLEVKWFTDPHIAFALIVFVVLWKVAGYYALFLFASLEGMQTEILEAAEIDGAGVIRRFIFITLPLIGTSLQSVIMLATGLVFGIFSEPYLLTGGGPAKSTLSWQLLLYNTSFVSFKSGYGAVIAIILGLCIFVSLRILVSVSNRFVQSEN